MKKVLGWTAGAALLIAVIVFVLMVVFEDPHVAHGRDLFAKYCAACHGVKGDGGGFNAELLDPYPRDLTDYFEPYMAEGTNEEIFSAIATGVSGFAPPMEGLSKHVHDHNGVEEEDRDMPGMEDHDMSGMEDHDMSGMEDHDMSGMEEDHEMPGMEARDDGHQDDGHAHGEVEEPAGGHEDTEEDMDMEEEGGMGSPLMPYWGFTLSDQEMWELVAFIRTLHRNDAPAVEFEMEKFDEQRRRPSYEKDIRFPPMDSNHGRKMIVRGEKLAKDHFACNACHEINGEGGKIGPSLDRSGVRLNAKWVYRWIQNPQSIRRDTMMPAFGLPEKDAKAITLYLMTLKGEGEPEK